MAERGLNRVELIGRVGRDPEVRYISSGKCVTTFTFATTESWKGQDGEVKEKTEWHNIEAWKRLAEIIGDHVVKGQKLYIEGRLETQSWDDDNGNRRSKTKIIANNMIMLSAGRKAGGGGGDRQSNNRSSGYGDEAPF